MIKRKPRIIARLKIELDETGVFRILKGSSAHLLLAFAPDLEQMEKMSLSLQEKTLNKVRAGKQ